MYKCCLGHLRYPVVLQSLSCAQLRHYGLQHARHPCPSTSPRNLLQLMSIESVMPSNHLILCHPLLLLPSVFPSIRVFSNKSAPHIRWPKYWSFSIRSSNEYSGLISFRIDWFSLALQGILKGLLQHHSAFFMIQLTSIHDDWKNHSLD